MGIKDVSQRPLPGHGHNHRRLRHQPVNVHSRQRRATVCGQRLELGKDRGADGLVLRTVATADADAADDLAVEHQREAPDEDGELAGQHVADPERLVAGQRGSVRWLVEQMGGPLVARGGEGLGDGDLHPREPGPRQPVQGKDVAAVVADAQRLLDADLLGLRASGRQQRQCVVQRDPMNLVHGGNFYPPNAAERDGQHDPSKGISLVMLHIAPVQAILYSGRIDERRVLR